MAQRQSGIAVAMPPAGAWPPDDTEESVVGTNLQQATITNLRTGLNEVASGLAAEGERPPWYALSQTGISGLRHPDGSPYTVLSDVFVYDHPIDERRATLSLAVEGPPRLVIEVLSEKTHERDLDMAKGKGYSYADAGVPEYLLLDPAGDYLPEQGQGWRLERGVYAPWRRDADGRWHSEQLGVAIAFEGVQVAVYGPDGQRQLREGEVAKERRRWEQEIAELRRRLAGLGRGE